MPLKESAAIVGNTPEQLTKTFQVYWDNDMVDQSCEDLSFLLRVDESANQNGHLEFQKKL